MIAVTWGSDNRAAPASGPARAPMNTSVGAGGPAAQGQAAGGRARAERGAAAPTAVRMRRLSNISKVVAPATASAAPLVPAHARQGCSF